MGIDESKSSTGITGAAYRYDPGRAAWEKTARNILPTMDHRGLAGTGDTLTLIGGMTSRGRVTPRVETFSLPRRP